MNNANISIFSLRGNDTKFLFSGRNDVTNVQGYVETYNNAQWTTFIFTRPLNSGDTSDIAIVNGPMHLLYAVGQSGSVNYGANTFQQHSSKGDVVVNFFDLNGTVVASRKFSIFIHYQTRQH